MGATEMKRGARLAYREAAPQSEEGAPVLLVHGFPESSYMWQELLGPIAASGRRAVAPDLIGYGDSPPDLIGYGDSPPDRPATWERHMEALGELRDELELGPVALVVHDWGGLIGLRWACENPGAVTGIVASNTGLFPDGKWHGFAKAMRAEGQGEELMKQMTREALAATLHSQSDGFDETAIGEYWKALESEDGRMGILEMYRSGDFEKLEPYRGMLAELGVPFLALWGEDDPFAPIAGAYRFRKEVPGAEVVAVEGAGHFVYADDPERCAFEVVRFLRESAA